MKSLLITPGGSRYEVPAGISGLEAVKNLVAEGKEKTLQEAVCLKIDGRLVDLATRLPEGAEVFLVTPESPEALEVLRHSTSHIMAQAVTRLFPEAKLGIGPAIADGFDYDFGLPQTLTPEDLEKIEAEMGKIIKED